MPRIKFEEYAQNVEACRQILYNHCIQNGRDISSNASLNELIQVNNQIKSTEADNIYKVEWIDIDGTNFKAIDYIKKGSALNIPESIPVYDSDCLEFVRWGFNCNPNNITHNTKCIPIYQCKEVLPGIRPTILKLAVNSYSAYEFTFTFYNYNGEGSSYAYGLDPIYVDWGDGTTDSFVATANSTNTTAAHIYIADGVYNVKIWAETVNHTYTFKYDNTYGILSTNNQNSGYALLALYLGSQYRSLSYHLLYPKDVGLPNLNVITAGISSTVSLGRYAIRNNIRAFVIPNEVRCSSSDYGPVSGPILEHLVAEWDRTTPLIRSDSNDFFDSGCYHIKEFYYPENLEKTMFNKYQIQKTHIGKVEIPSGAVALNCFQNNAITDLYIPDTVSYVSLSECPNLQSISYPKSVTNLSGQIWRYNKVLSKIEFRGNTTLSDSNVWYQFGDSLTEFKIPNDYTGILNLKSAINLTDESLMNIAINLKQTSGYSITFPNNLQMKLHLLTINNQSMLTYIQNKGWTVSFA